MAHPIEKKIAERELQCQELDREISTRQAEKARLEAEIAAYKDALQYVSGPAPRAKRNASTGQKRAISEQWVTYLKTASSDGAREFTVDDIVDTASLYGHEVKRPSIRTQAANFVTRGTLDRVRDGVFRVTVSGAKELGVTLPPKENEEAEASSEPGQVSTPDLYSHPSLPGA